MVTLSTNIIIVLIDCAINASSSMVSVINAPPLGRIVRNPMFTKNCMVEAIRV